jgi:signal peptidase I
MRLYLSAINAGKYSLLRCSFHLRHAQACGYRRGVRTEELLLACHGVRRTVLAVSEEQDDQAENDQPPADVTTPADRMAGRLTRVSLLLLVSTLLALLVQSLFFQQFYVSGTSMDDTLHEPDRVLVEKITGRFRDFGRGDIVVFTLEMEDGPRDLIKRVIGLPGETVEVRDCQVLVDGVDLAEPYLGEPSPGGCGRRDVGPLLVPENEYFVLGDNREQSADSRIFGPVPESSFIGRAVLVVWPVGGWRTL